MSVSDKKDNELGDLVQFVKTYAKQETVGPLRNIGRWMGWGIAGAVMLGFGLFMLVLGLLRLLQTEADGVFRGNWTWAPYAIAMVVCILAIGIAVWRMSKTTLDREERR